MALAAGGNEAVGLARELTDERLPQTLTQQQHKSGNRILASYGGRIEENFRRAARAINFHRAGFGIDEPAELRAIAEVYAYDEAKFARDFVAAWTQVMDADRFDRA